MPEVQLAYGRRVTTHSESFLDWVSLLPLLLWSSVLLRWSREPLRWSRVLLLRRSRVLLLRWSRLLGTLLRMRTGMEEEDGVGDRDEEATLKWWPRRESSAGATGERERDARHGEEGEASP